MEKVLKELGLTENEAKIYLFLLKKGATTTGSIIKETKISNSRVYASLNTLQDKGLITYTIQKNGKHFESVDPKRLLYLEEERKENIAKIIPILSQWRNTTEIETISAVYEGFQGFKTAFQKIIDDCPNDGEIFIIGFSEQPYATKSLRTFISNMNLRSAKKKQRLKILLDITTRKTLGKDRAKEKYSEIRYMPQGYVSPASIDIMGEYVYMFLWEEKPYVFMIKNQRLADSFKQYFHFLWQMSKK